MCFLLAGKIEAGIEMNRIKVLLGNLELIVATEIENGFASNKFLFEWYRGVLLWMTYLFINPQLLFLHSLLDFFSRHSFWRTDQQGTITLHDDGECLAV